MVLETLMEKISPCHTYLFTQYNQDMLTPLHCAIRSKNKEAVIELLSLTKKLGFYSEKVITATVGRDELPLIHFLGIMLKAYEIDKILHRNLEINLFERDTRGNPATFFEYYANNNFDNHKKWVLMKQQQRVYFNKFQKPCRSYKKICAAEIEFTKTVCSQSQSQSEYHTYTQVLKKLRSNNAKQAEKLRSIRQRKMKRM